MKCTVSQSDVTTSGERHDLKYNLKVFIIAETPEEGMELGFIAIRMRNENLWNVIHKEEAKLEVEFWGK